MSLEALTWAFSQDVPTSSRKFVLVALSNYANEHNLCYPSTETICRLTSLDRKTVINCLDDLESLGFILDTKDRIGITKQIKVFKIKGSQKRNHSENGTIPFFPSKAPKNGIQIQKKEPLVKETGKALPVKILHGRLCALFKRPTIARWGYEEERLLCEVAKREDCLSELAELEKFYAVGSYLPQKLERLLADWTGQLDRSRTNHDNQQRNQTTGKNNQQRISASAGTSNEGTAASYANAPALSRTVGKAH